MKFKKNKIIIYFVSIVLVVFCSYFLIKDIGKNEVVKEKDFLKPLSEPDVNSTSTQRIYKFENFHGSTDISDKFSFVHPLNWHVEGQYFSPQKIGYYSVYNVRSAAYFDLINASIFNNTEIKYQIDHSKMRSSPLVGVIDGKNFTRYDMDDYGTYGGESAGRVITYVGPKIKIDNIEYVLVFHWEEKPLTFSLQGNNPEDFDRAVLSLKFFK